MTIPIINRFTCSYNNLYNTIKHIKSKNIRPLIANINENQNNHKNNYQEIKELIHMYPNNYIALKLSSLNINNYSEAFDYSYKLCNYAIDNNCKIIIDAENYEIQDDINTISNTLMGKFNRYDVNVYKTYQLYRNDYFNKFIGDITKQRDYKIGFKLVRGAYYNKEKGMKHICKSKRETDQNYNRAIQYFNNVYHINDDKLICATHNEYSINKAKKFDNKNIAFAQLMGMSDDISNKLVEEKFKVLKYIPYGNYTETIPYFGRRLYENYDFIKYLIR